ncbi:hypothetical protein AsAng_0050190 [Aureispira anguillae]|uniref:Uncharacterized protein n=1 Tax=Aureispira anguillae TaxID=2864201 RepID=A0A915YJA0_9BACT|nr:hypothetical protein AsAng_0050190 [Aureispira anguillae]
MDSILTFNKLPIYIQKIGESKQSDYHLFFLFSFTRTNKNKHLFRKQIKKQHYILIKFLAKKMLDAQFLKF